MPERRAGGNTVRGVSSMAGMTRTQYVKELAEAHETMIRAGIEPVHNPDCAVCRSFDHATYRRVLGLSEDDK